MNYTKTIPERIKDLRKERNVTLEEVAEATGLSRSAIGNYEDTEGVTVGEMLSAVQPENIYVF